MTAVEQAELANIASLAPAGYFIGLRIRAGGADKLFNTYPRKWRLRYGRMSYLLRDPTLAWGYTHTGVIHWEELAGLDTGGIFSDALNYGLAYGVTVAVGPVDARTIGSLARNDRRVSEDEAAAFHTSLTRLHRYSVVPVTAKEQHAIRLIAEGRTYAIAAHELGISITALRARLTSARKRLGADTISDLVQVARSRSLL